MSTVTKEESIAFIEGVRVGSNLIIDRLTLGIAAHRKPVREYLMDMIPHLKELSKYVVDDWRKKAGVEKETVIEECEK